MRLALAGVALGLLAAIALSRLVVSLLFEVRTWDPAAFVAAPIFLTTVALLAAWLPAARASRLDPIQALRVE